MSAQIGTVRNLRIFVEPVEVELDEDEGLLWTSLQTAFPGCSGMYYKERESPCKSSVKFDGKKFRAPGGAWNDREYFVTLSQRCHAGQGTLGSYENASKQFERSVNAVQAMLASTMGGRRLRVGSTVLPPSPPTEQSISNSAISSEPMEANHAVQERETLLRSANRQLTPIEQQFVDLAKISTGKDAVIEGHREQIRKLTDQLATAEKKLEETSRKCQEFEMKVAAQEEELRLFRELGEQQKCMNTKVAELTSALERSGLEVRQLRESWEQKETDWGSRERDLRERVDQLDKENNQLKQEIGEVREKLQVSEVSRDLLSTELDQLRPLADLIELDEPSNVKKYSETLTENCGLNERNLQLEKEVEETRQLFEEIQNIQNSMTMENTRLVSRNTELEGRLAHVDEELTKINGEWKERLEEQLKEWKTQKSDYEQEIEVVKSQLADVQKMLEVASRDAAENARRLSDVTQAREEMRRAFESSEFRHQEPLKREIKALSEDLKESQERVAELTSLVGSLTSDAHNSRRDIADLI